MLVIARAYKNEPLVRTVVGTGDGVIFLHNQDASSAHGPVDKSGVGFPKDCVFPFEESLYRALRGLWLSGQHAELANRWQDAAPIRELDHV